MRSSKHVWIGLLGTAVILVLAWSGLRYFQLEPSTLTTVPAPGQGPTVTGERPDPAAVRRSVGMHRSGGPEAEEGAEGEPGPIAVLPVAELVQEREALYAQLVAAGNPMLPEVTQVFTEQGIQEPAAIASGWMLARNWGIFARSETNAPAAASAMEDPRDPERLAKARRRILLEAPIAELRAVLGGTVAEPLLSGLEAVGRRNSATPMAVPGGAEERREPPPRFQPVEPE